ncbi:MAG: hypothetical protein HQK71_08485 [Desulfamplus sp.]|nr:hypothetical protein [Desulfamplus sp.]
MSNIVQDNSFYIFLSATTIFGIWGLWLKGVYNLYILPTVKIADEIVVIQSVNPYHRIKINAGKEVEYLAGRINEVADRYLSLKRDIDNKIQLARKELEQEKDILASIISSLAEGIIVCNLSGTVLLFNKRAEGFLTNIDKKDVHSIKRQFIGLGRDISSIIDKKKIDSAVEELRLKLLHPFECCSTSFSIVRDNEGLLNINIVPVLSRSGEFAGFILNINEATAQLSINGLSAPPSHLPITLGSDCSDFYDFYLFNRAEINPAIQDELLSNITYTVVDTETTGLDPLTDEIIAVAAVRIVNGKLLKNEIFNTLVNPKRAISEESIKIHGIRPEMVEGHPTIGKILPILHKFAENTVLVGHNIAFDMRMFQVKEHLSNVQFTQPILDTLLLSAVIHPSHRYHNLEEISERLGITIKGRHTALGDSFAAAEILLKMVPLLARNGILTLKDAIEASRKTKYAKISY